MSSSIQIARRLDGTTRVVLDGKDITAAASRLQLDMTPEWSRITVEYVVRDVEVDVEVDEHKADEHKADIMGLYPCAHDGCTCNYDHYHANGEAVACTCSPATASLCPTTHGAPPCHRPAQAGADGDH